MSNLSVLFVEDNPDDVALLQLALARVGSPWRIEQVSGLGLALDRLAQPPPLDAVLLDLNLPDAGGVETVARVRAAARDVAIVVLTGGRGQGDAAEGVEALQQGADEYLVKDAGLTGSAVQRAMTHALERRLATQRLEASEARYRGLVEMATDIIYRTDPAGRFTYVNPVALRVMGYAEEELIGRHFGELIHPDQRAEVEQRYAAQREQRTPSTQLEFVALTRDGREVWIEQRVQPVLEGERVVAFQAVARDVSERKGIEAERERLISDLREALAQVRTLRELLPMCANCRRIKDEEDGSWSQLEYYLAKRNAGTLVTHSICPQCEREIYPDLARRKEARKGEGKS